MNSTISLNLTELNQISLDILKSQKIPYILWVVFSTVNLITASLTLLVIYYWKKLRTSTNFLVSNLAVSDWFLSTQGLYGGIVHSYNIYNEIPETMTRAECRWKSGLGHYFVNVCGLTYLSISIDRFVASIFPLTYKHRHRHSHRIAALFVWTLATVMLILGYLDRPENSKTYIVVCVSREAVNETMFTVYLLVILFSNFFSVLIYALTMLLLKVGEAIKNRKTSNRSDQSNLAEIRRRTTNRVTKALALNGLVHFCTVMAAALGSALIARLPNRGANLSPYFALGTLGATLNFLLYYFTQRHFRDGFQNLLNKFCCKTYPTKKFSVASNNRCTSEFSEKTGRSVEEANRLS